MTEEAETMTLDAMADPEAVRLYCIASKHINHKENV